MRKRRHRHTRNQGASSSSGMGIEIGQLIFEYSAANEQLDIVRVR